MGGRAAAAAGVIQWQPDDVAVSGSSSAPPAEHALDYAAVRKSPRKVSAPARAWNREQCRSRVAVTRRRSPIRIGALGGRHEAHKGGISRQRRAGDGLPAEQAGDARRCGRDCRCLANRRLVGPECLQRVGCARYASAAPASEADVGRSSGVAARGTSALNPTGIERRPGVCARLKP